MSKSKLVSLAQLQSLPAASELMGYFEIDGLGLIQVRAISLNQVYEMRTSCNVNGTYDRKRWQALILAAGLKEPALSFDEAKQLLDKAAGPIDDLLSACLRFSGLTDRGQIAELSVQEAEAAFRGE